MRKIPASGKPLKIWDNISIPRHKKYKLFFTHSAFGPFAHGIIDPKVLLPNNSIKWSDQKLYATLIHETAHLHRRDPLTRMISFVVRAILWFHPLVWLAHRQLIQAQEESCDQAALASGIAAEDYATELLSSASRFTHTPQNTLSMARWSQMGKRINRIINHPANNPVSMKTILTIITVTAATAFTIATTGFAQEMASENTAIKKVEHAHRAAPANPTTKKAAPAHKVVKEDYNKSDRHNNAATAFTIATTDFAQEMASENASIKKGEHAHRAAPANPTTKKAAPAHKVVKEDYNKSDRHNNAKAEFQKDLKINPDNKAARRKLEKITDLQSEPYCPVHNPTKKEHTNKAHAAH